MYLANWLQMYITAEHFLQYNKYQSYKHLRVDSYCVQKSDPDDKQ